MSGILIRLSDRLATSLRALRADERGQSLIIVALSMTVALGVSAIAIDVASWYQKHHQAQVAADAAALAAANCLANSGPTQPCTSATDVTGAQQMAVDYARRNGVTIQTSQVSVNTKKDIVTVHANSAAPAFFARLFGISNANVSAGSGASWKVAATMIPCNSTDSSGCAAIYAGNTSCGSGTGLYFGTNDSGKGSGHAAMSVTGIIHSEGSMTLGSGGNTKASGLTVAGSCYSGSSMPSAGKTTATQVSSEPWPVDYSKAPYFSACTGDCAKVDGVSGVPSYCTYATTSDSGFTFTDVNNTPQLPADQAVYCSVGSGNPSDPSTWNGPIQFQTSDPSNPGQCNNGGDYASATFIGGNITATSTKGPLCLQPAPGTNCLFYATGSVDLRQHMYWTGDIFDPTGTVQLGTTSDPGPGNGGGDYKSSSGLIEALNVNDANVSLNLTGDGPAVSGGGGGSSSSSGSDNLVS